jgi:hypothetical protein
VLVVDDADGEARAFYSAAIHLVEVFRSFCWLDMRFLKLAGLTLCAISLTSFMIVSADAATAYHSPQHHYHHHHAGKGKTGGRH